MSELGNWLKKKMDERGLTYNATAVYAGIGQATISDIINKGHVPRVDTLFTLADFFNTPREEVLRRAGILSPRIGEGDNQIPPDIRALVDQLLDLWLELRRTDPEAMERLKGIVVMQAEMVLATARATQRNSEEREQKPQRAREEV